MIYKIEAFAGNQRWVCCYAGNKKTADKISIRLSKTFRTIVVEKLKGEEAKKINPDWVERF